MKTTDKRSTLVLEGAIAEKGPWKEIAFHNLPSVVDKVPSFIRTFQLYFVLSFHSWSL